MTAGWRPVLALLRESLWLRALLAVIAFSVACVFLGRWQFHRHEAKVARADRVSANYDAAAVPLAALLPGPDTALPLRDEWRRVQVTGQYLPAATVLVRNRPLDGEYGFEVLVPLRTGTGSTLLVDRGWIPFGQNASAPVTAPAPPPGEVSVVARLRRSEPPGSGAPTRQSVARITVPQIAEQLADRLDGPVYHGYAVLDRETPAAAGVSRLPRPDTGLGPHLAYAVQWWAFGLVGYVLLVVYGRREVERRLAAGRPVARRQPAGADRSRDEEVEDEQVERALRAAASGPAAAAPPRSER